MLTENQEYIDFSKGVMIKVTAHRRDTSHWLLQHTSTLKSYTSHQFRQYVKNILSNFYITSLEIDLVRLNMFLIEPIKVRRTNFLFYLLKADTENQMSQLAARGQLSIHTKHLPAVVTFYWVPNSNKLLPELGVYALNAILIDWNLSN